MSSALSSRHESESRPETFPFDIGSARSRDHVQGVDVVRAAHSAELQARTSLHVRPHAGKIRLCCCPRVS